MKKIILIIFILNSVIAFTQTDSMKSYKYPLEVLITAPRFTIPLKDNSFATSIIEKPFLRTLPKTISIDEALKLVPGVKIDNQANGERIHLSIRGQGILTERGIRGIRLIQDGIPINDPTGFAPDVYDVDFSNLSRIEVVRGPGASLYGGSSSAGIINFITDDGPPSLFGASVLGIAGSNKFWKSRGQFGATVKNLNYNVSFSREMGDGYRQHTHFWGNKVYGKATYKPTSYISLMPLFSYTNVYHENPEGINLTQYQEDPLQANPDAIPFNEYLETKRITTGLVGSIGINKSNDISFNIYAKTTNFTEANNHTFVDRTLQTPGTSIQYNLHLGEKNVVNHLSAGIDMQWQTIYEKRVANNFSVRGNDLLSDETIHQRGLGAFIIDRVELYKKFNLTASVRYDNILNQLNDNMRLLYDLSGEKKFDKTTGRFGVTYSPNNDINLYANVGTGFMPPATEELAQNPLQFGGFNDALVPATSVSEDLGIRGTYKNILFYDLAGFYMTTKNDFDRYRITDPLRNQETFYKTVGSSRRFGLELFTRFTPVKQLNIQLAYTYSNFKYTNDVPSRIVMDDTSIYKYAVDGNYLPNSPEHQLYAEIQYEIVPGLFVALNSESLSKAYIDGANIESEAVDGYTLFGARLEYHYNLKYITGEVTFNVTNIGDKKYVAFSEPDPGGNAYQPGAGRQFFGSVKINF